VLKVFPQALSFSHNTSATDRQGRQTDGETRHRAKDAVQHSCSASKRGKLLQEGHRQAWAGFRQVDCMHSTF